VWCSSIRGVFALVTVDFVWIYDLTSDTNKARHQLIIPAGQIRDVTFAVSDEVLSNDGKTTAHRIYLFVLSSMGNVYVQELNEQCRLEDDGSFYMTSWVTIKHGLSVDQQGIIAGGGLSIHYSHTCRLLFVGYAQGRIC
jgi:hypothetical protein